jgi:hypothetical protein
VNLLPSAFEPTQLETAPPENQDTSPNKGVGPTLRAHFFILTFYIFYINLKAAKEEAMRIGERTQEESSTYILFLVIAEIAGLLFAEVWTMSDFTATLADLIRNGCSAHATRTIVAVIMKGVVVVAFGVILEYAIYDTKWLKKDVAAK